MHKIVKYSSLNQLYSEKNIYLIACFLTIMNFNDSEILNYRVKYIVHKFLWFKKYETKKINHGLAYTGEFLWLLINREKIINNKKYFKKYLEAK